MRKSQFVIITGPESSGKSTLTEALSIHYGMPLVDEIARWYLPGIKRNYNYTDLINISRLETINLLNNRYNAAPLIFSDTWLLVMRVWMEVRYGKCEPWIKSQLSLYRENFYLLCAPDIPWEYDPLRENPDDRWKLYERYVDILDDLKLTYAVIRGDEENRLRLATQAVERLR